jgi:hypothetical protein
VAKLLLWAYALAAIAALVLAQTGSGPYQPDWNSLTAHQDAAWFRDAKLGIYNHWGPVTYATVQQSESGIQVSVPAARRHAIDTIVRLELDGPASTLPILHEG